MNMGVKSVIFLPLLLASLLAGAHATSNDGRLPERNQACDEQILTLSCPQGYVMTFTDAFYGRDDLEYCLSNDINDVLLDNCSHPDPLPFLSASCGNSNECSFSVNASQFGDDPCQGTSKFLVADYYCSETVETELACEGSNLLLECPENQALHIKDLFYGRRDEETCSHDTALLATNCSSTTALNVLQELCISKQTCDIYVLSSLLGEPCSGTYKYLEVDYSCFECANLHGDDDACDEWASWGECDINSDWMTAFCRKSCLRCDYQQACENSYSSEEDCLYWASVGECNLNTDWMHDNCKKACNACPLEDTRNPSTPTTPTTPSVPECINLYGDDDECHKWVGWGECEVNSDWMTEFCRKACLKCDSQQPCENTYSSEEDCEHWASIGECSLNTDWMHDNCKKACNVCVEVTTTTPATPFVPIWTEDECYNVDTDDICDYWQETNECSTNSAWMAKNCAKSCGVCSEGNHTVWTKDKCYNVDTDAICDHWKQVDECALNPAWMSKNCAKSCGVCQVNTTVWPDDHCYNTKSDAICEYWKTNHECIKNPDWMAEQCAKSCGVCNKANDTKIEVSSQVACETETVSMVCGQSEGLRIHEAFYGRTDNTTCAHSSVLTDDCPSHWSVTDTVKSTCQGRQWCHASAHSEVFPDPCPGTYKYLEVKYECQECVNAYGDDAECNRWADEGECEANSNWMAKYCFKTCSRCDVSECLNPVEDDVSCDYWAMGRECELNAEWMAYNCQESCRQCTEEIHRDRTLPPTPTSTLSTNQASTTTTTTLPSPIHTTMCEGSSATLTCPQDKGIIVTFAFYGRESWDICPNGLPFQGDLLCSSTTILDDLKRQCNGQPTCQIEGLPYLYGDPCNGLLKYLETVHECVGLDTFNCGLGCGENGKCISANECICEKGYTGEGCSEFSCAQEGHCSGHGQCTGPGQCSCDEGWSGPTCEVCNDNTCEIAKPSTTTTDATVIDENVSTLYPVAERIKIEVLLSTPWSEEYEQTAPVNSISLVDKTLTQLSNYLSSIHVDHLGLASTQLSSTSGSQEVLVTTELRLQKTPSNMVLFRGSLFCHLSDAFDAGLIQNTTGVRATLTKEEDDVCTTMATYCGDHGQVEGSSPDQASCKCFDGYSGSQCQIVSKWETTKLIIIIVVCTVVLLGAIVVLCCLHRHKHFIRSRFKTSLHEELQFQALQEAQNKNEEQEKAFSNGAYE